jgi:hypothetical protein
LANLKLFMSLMNFSLKRNIMTFVLYFGYQNSWAIHTEKGILPVLYFFNKIKLSITMTKRLSSVKEGLQSYCNKVYLRSSFNTMWILKYSYDLLDHFNSRFNSREVHLSKKWPQQFTHHSSWKCINTFKEIICNAVNYKRVTNVKNL